MISSIDSNNLSTNYKSNVDRTPVSRTQKTKKPQTNYTIAEFDTIYKERDIYNNYTDWDAVVYLGDSPLANSLGGRIQRDAKNVFEDFYDNKIDESDVKDYMKKACDLLIEYCSYCTPENQITDAEKEEVIGNIYEVFVHTNMEMAVYKCEKIGEEYNGQHVNRRDFVYYDADIYYKWKDFAVALEKSAEEIGQNILGENVDFSRYLGGLYGYNDFNLHWSFMNREKRLSTMIDCSLEPPQNFKFFYKFTEDNNCHYANKYDCNLVMWLDNKRVETLVPLDKPTAGVLTHDGEQALLGKYSNFLSDDTPIKKFMSNIRIFTPFYGVRFYDEINSNLLNQMNCKNKKSSHNLRIK